ncbi:high mobility group nucleosome-binding domain-containing protein 3 [Brachionichthys hirsutus]|uniref:high mobility group nucleosome-binding domain-containing protein 3 n=1 Tax=Brachionichthys hirsutus TaxID=412623 RepID=UPI0036047F11
MPKRKQNPDVPEGKESSKVTKREPTRRSERISEKTVPLKVEAKPKKTVTKKVADDKGVKATKKGGAKGKKDDSPTQNGEAKTNEVTEAAEEAAEEKA